MIFDDGQSPVHKKNTYQLWFSQVFISRFIRRKEIPCVSINEFLTFLSNILLQSVQFCNDRTLIGEMFGIIANKPAERRREAGEAAAL